MEKMKEMQGRMAAMHKEMGGDKGMLKSDDTQGMGKMMGQCSGMMDDMGKMVGSGNMTPEEMANMSKMMADMSAMMQQMSEGMGQGAKKAN